MDSNLGLSITEIVAAVGAEKESLPEGGGIWGNKPDSALISAETSAICARLLDSEEHAGDCAVPTVAEEAAAMIQQLAKALAATQLALSNAMQAAKNGRDSSVESA